MSAYQHILRGADTNSISKQVQRQQEEQVCSVWIATRSAAYGLRPAVIGLVMFNWISKMWQKGIRDSQLQIHHLPFLMNLGIASSSLPERRSILVVISANLTAMWAVWQSSTGA